MNRQPALGCAAALALTTLALSACGSSSETTAAKPTPSTTPAPSVTTEPPTDPPTSTPPSSTATSPPSTGAPAATASLAGGAKSASCVNGWVQPAPGSDFYKQASSALDTAEGATGYVIKSVRYFAGPLATGGIGAIYYLDVRDPRLSSRVLLVSGAGPAAVAVAKTGTAGWKPADWTAPGGGALTVSLLPSMAGCLDGT